MEKKHLTAPPGMVLTNGDVCASEVWLGNWDSPDNWRVITKEEASVMRSEEEGL